jgi:hypothetical protein
LQVHHLQHHETSSPTLTVVFFTLRMIKSLKVNFSSLGFSFGIKN